MQLIPNGQILGAPGGAGSAPIIAFADSGDQLAQRSAKAAHQLRVGQHVSTHRWHEHHNVFLRQDRPANGRRGERNVDGKVKEDAAALVSLIAEKVFAGVLPPCPSVIISAFLVAVPALREAPEAEQQAFADELLLPRSRTICWRSALPKGLSFSPYCEC